MTRQLWLASVLAIAAVTPALSETAPSAVVYVEGAVAESLSGAAGDPASGAKIMTTNALGNCVACHAIGTMPDVPFQGTIAPPLDGVADRYDEAQLRGIVANAKMSFDGTFMPAFYKTEGFIRPGAAYSGKAPEGDLPPILDAQQIEDVVAYLLTLKESDRPKEIKEMTMKLSRRDALWAGLGGIASATLANPLFAKTVEELSAEFTGGAAPGAEGITLTAPEIAENGNTVPVSVSAPGAVAIMLLAAGNPEPAVCTFAFGPAAGSQNAATRIRLAKTQDVIAMAKMADGSIVQASATVKVTIGGCGG